MPEAELCGAVGNFTDDLTDDLTGLTPENSAALVDWRNFYMEHKAREGIWGLDVGPCLHPAAQYSHASIDARTGLRCPPMESPGFGLHENGT